MREEPRSRIEFSKFYRRTQARLGADSCGARLNPQRIIPCYVEHGRVGDPELRHAVGKIGKALPLWFIEAITWAWWESSVLHRCGSRRVWNRSAANYADFPDALSSPKCRAGTGLEGDEPDREFDLQTYSTAAVTTGWGGTS
ncbi:hypothetical protein R1flu_023968 [Riccia fluitans]|uniref:Uncharacterized protein n=1 Tax=Riccia fluitans TaxID=41844 RepID=A0ABD1XTJ8_9MARC